MVGRGVPILPAAADLKDVEESGFEGFGIGAGAKRPVIEGSAASDMRRDHGPREAGLDGETHEGRHAQANLVEVAVREGVAGDGVEGEPFFESIGRGPVFDVFGDVMQVQAASRSGGCGEESCKQALQVTGTTEQRRAGSGADAVYGSTVGNGVEDFRRVERVPGDADGGQDHGLQPYDP